ncbi:MAG: hypothetical protein M3083_01595, partial [Actinomycetota bacterium]|nr:hypothetical protein [Actinomycetota bacterium]
MGGCVQCRRTIGAASAARGRGDEEDTPPPAGQELGQRRQEATVSVVVARAGDLALQDRQLVA